MSDWKNLDGMWRCPWCGKRFKKPSVSGWEQQNVKTGVWWPMCNRCANRRLNNPYAALLPMRRAVAS